MGNSTHPDALREGENNIPIASAQIGHESVNSPTANDQGKSKPVQVADNTVTSLSATIGEFVAAAREAQGVVVPFDAARRRLNKGKKGIKPAQQVQIKIQPPSQSAIDESDIPSHPDEEEILQYPSLVAFVENIDEGYEVIANIYCKMRITIRAILVRRGEWNGVPGEIPENRYWCEPITFDRAVRRLENPKLDLLVDRASNPNLSIEIQDKAYYKLFGIVAQTLLMMERRFLRYKFHDDFIHSICDHLIDRFGEPDKGIRPLLMAKLGKDFELFTRKQAEQRWGSMKLVSTDVPSTPSTPVEKTTNGLRLVVDDYELPEVKEE
jgi:hypothetical protein